MQVDACARIHVRVYVYIWIYIIYICMCMYVCVYVYEHVKGLLSHIGDDKSCHDHKCAFLSMQVDACVYICVYMSVRACTHI